MKVDNDDRATRTKRRLFPKAAREFNPQQGLGQPNTGNCEFTILSFLEKEKKRVDIELQLRKHCHNHFNSFNN